MSSNRGAYLMAKMTGRGLQPGMLFGGKAEIDRMDVAAACARSQGTIYLLLRVKYCNDVSSIASGIKSLVEFSESRFKGFENLDEIQKMAACTLLIQEFISEARCAKCEGTGSSIDPERGPIKCPKCSGTGKHRNSESYRAKGAGVPYTSWRNKGLHKDFDDCLSSLQSLEIDALAKIAKRVA